MRLKRIAHHHSADPDTRPRHTNAAAHTDTYSYADSGADGDPDAYSDPHPNTFANTDARTSANSAAGTRQ